MAPRRVNEQEVIQLYLTPLPVKEVATRLGCDPTTIYGILRNNGVPLRSRCVEDDGEMRTCTTCGVKKNREINFSRSAKALAGRSRCCKACAAEKQVAKNVYGTMADRSIAISGRSNPNAKYLQVDDFLFKQIDSEEKAYLLGWIASDGHVARSGWEISIHRRDVRILESLRDLVDPGLPVKHRVKRGMVNLTAHSKQMSLDLCELLDISPGKKSHTVGFPAGLPEEFEWDFLRGLFDGDGHIVKVGGTSKTPKAGLSSCSPRMRASVAQLAGGIEGPDKVVWHGRDAVDFLSRLYDNANPRLRLQRKYEAYLDWCSWVPSLAGPGSYGTFPHFRWTRTTTDAAPPCREASGYELTLIEKVATWGDVEVFDTGIKVEPAAGLFFLVTPRNFLRGMGYSLANSTEVVAGPCGGTVLVSLKKVNPDAVDIPLPLRCIQMIPTASLRHPAPDIPDTRKAT